jgi:hypothetical protein
MEVMPRSCVSRLTGRSRPLFGSRFGHRKSTAPCGTPPGRKSSASRNGCLLRTLRASELSEANHLEIAA